MVGRFYFSTSEATPLREFQPLQRPVNTPRPFCPASGIRVPHPSPYTTRLDRRGVSGWARPPSNFPGRRRLEPSRGFARGGGEGRTPGMPPDGASTARLRGMSSPSRPRVWPSSWRWRPTAPPWTRRPGRRGTGSWIPQRPVRWQRGRRAEDSLFGVVTTFFVPLVLSTSPPHANPDKQPVNVNSAP